MTDIIAFTCASGKQCSAIVPFLYPDFSKYRLRLVVHSKSSYDRLTKEYPQAEVFQANLDDPADRAKIVRGVSVLYYVSPTFNPHETKFGQGMVDAACEEAQRPDSKFSHFVLSSVLHTHLRKLLNHDRKREIEEYLCESPLRWTVLQASYFMDNSIGHILALRDKEDPVYTAAHNVDIPFSFSCVHDHAEASVKVIKEGSKHFYATYQLVSTWPITYRKYLQQLGEVIGKDIRIEKANYEDQLKSFCKLFFGSTDVEPRLREGPARLLLYYNERGLPGNPRVTEWVLGRPATTPTELAKMILAKPGA